MQESIGGSIGLNSEGGREANYEIARV